MSIEDRQKLGKKSSVGVFRLIIAPIKYAIRSLFPHSLDEVCHFFIFIVIYLSQLRRYMYLYRGLSADS
jgi:hypothetical protein